jgi:glycosyltransferase involved in cell wall biosynthesis
MNLYSRAEKGCELISYEVCVWVVLASYSMDKEIKLCFLVHRGFDLRYRVMEYIHPLKEYHVSTKIIRVKGRFLERFKTFDLLRGFDVVIIQRKVLSWIDRYLVRKSARRIIFDFDDAIMYKSSRWKNQHSRSKMARFKKMMMISDRVFAGNSFLKNEAARFIAEDKVLIVPTVVDLSKYSLKDYQAQGLGERVVTIGWIGSGGTLMYLEWIKPALERVGEKYGSKVRLKILCDRFFDCEDMQVVKKIWTEKDEVEELKSFDIGIMPLKDDLWTRGKCGLKLIQYMAVGVPVVCSPIGANREIVKDGVHGFWAESHDEWVEKLEILIKDHDLRKRMGMEGRKKVIKQYSPEANTPRMLKVFQQLTPQ